MSNSILARFVPRLAALCLTPFAVAQTWQDITGNLPGGTTLQADRGTIASDGTRLYAIGGPSGRGVLVSTDQGATFTPVNSVAGAGYALSEVNLLHTLRFAHDRLWVTGNDGSAAVNYLHWLTPGGTTWTQGSTAGFPPPASLASFGTISDLVYDAASARYFAMAEIGGVWSSADGSTWEPRTEGFGGIGAPASLAEVDGKIFALRPLSGLHRSTDAGLTWEFNSPHTDVDGAQLRRTGDALTFVVNGFSNTSIAYVSRDAGETWITSPGQPPNIGGNLSGDAQLLFTRSTNGRLLFSATAGLTWQDLPTAGVKVSNNTIFDPDFVGNFDPSRIERQGDYLFMIGNEVLDASFTTAARLYRIHLPGFDWRAETAIITQPVRTGGLAGDPVTLSVFAVGENLTYQWFQDGNLIPDATSAELTLPSPTTAQTGDYTVVVTGDRGAPATSTPVRVTIVAERIDGQLDRSFVPDSFSGSQLHRLPNGELLSARATAPSRFTRFDVDGRILASRSLSALLANQFYPVHTLIDSEGRIFAGGYTNATDTASNQRLRRFFADTLETDPSFPDLGGFNGTINGIAELPGRGYLVVGTFTRLNGTPVPPVLLVNYAGQPQLEFAAGLAISGITMVHVRQDGHILVNGTHPNFSPRRLALLDPSGRQVTGFPEFTATPQRFFALRDGRTLIVAAPGSARSLHLLRADNTFDPGFTPPGTLNNWIDGAAEQPDGRIVLVGFFTTFASQSFPGIVRLLPNGSIDPSYDTSASFDNNIVYGVTYHPDGYFFLAGGTPSSSFQGQADLGVARVYGQRADLAFLSVAPSRRVVLGTSTTLRVEAAGTSAVSYEWFRNGVLVPGATGPTLTLATFSAAQAGTYAVRITNASGTLTSAPIVVTGIGAPVIVVPPASADLLSGADLTLSVEVDGAGPFTYQWRRNGVDIPSATASSLALTNLQPAQAGDYSVVVANSFGSIETEPATLTVNTVSGVRDTTFTPNPSNGQVEQILRRPDGTLVVRGTFTGTIGGGSSGFAPRFAFLNPTTGLLSPEINRGGFNNNVNGIAVQSDGKVIVGGQFTNALGTTRNRLVRLNLDGTVDPTFNADGADPSATVLGVWVLSDDSILVNSGGGTYRGTAVGPLYRLLPDGTLDTAWNAAVGTGPTSANNIYAIAEQPDGRLVIGGAFGGFSGASGTSYLVRLLPDGSLDTSFNQTRPLPDYYVRAVAVQPDGKILLGGEFNNVGSASPAYRKLARLHPDGSLDTSFTAHSTVSTGQDVNALQLLPDGKILLGGTFTAWPGALGTHAGGRTVLLRPDGTVDPFYRPGSFNNTVWTLLALPEGRFYAGGAFTSPGTRLAAFNLDLPPLAITRQPASAFADLDGSAEFSVGIYTADTATYQWFKNGVLVPGATSASLTLSGLTRDSAGAYTVRVTNPEADLSVLSAAATLTVLAEPVIVTSPVSATVAPGGSTEFTVEAIGAGTLTYQWRLNGTALPGATSATLALAGLTTADAGLYDVVVTNDLGTAESNPAALTVLAPSGVLDTSFSNTARADNQTIRALSVLADGRIAVGGNFTFLNGQRRTGFGVLEADGNLGSLGSNPNISNVDALFEQADGKILVGVDALTGGSYRRLNADGSTDTTFAEASVITNAIRASDAHVYVGGFGFDLSGLRRLDLATGTPDADFNANAAAAGLLSARVRAFHLLPDGKILVGDSTNLRVLRLMPDGTLDPSFTSISLDGEIYAIAPAADGKLWIAGSFTTVAGDNTRRTIVRLLPDGALDTSIPGSGITNSGTGLSLVVQGNDAYLALSQLYTEGGQTWGSLVKISGATGRVDTTFGPILSTAAGFALAADAQGRLLLGGNFTTPRTRLARVITSYSGATGIGGQPRSQTVPLGGRAVFNVGWFGGGSASYAWFKDADPTPVATSAELVLDPVTAADAGSYRVVVTVGDQTLESDPATLSVVGGPAGPSGFFAWSELAALPEDQRAPLATPAGDGVTNLFKYALGIAPLADASAHLPQALLPLDVAGERYPAFRFIRPLARDGVIYAIAVSPDLDFVSDLGAEIVGSEDLGGGLEAVTVRSAVPLSVQSVQFLRLEVEIEP
jgi:uncharacterized delta-60 repeat protein